MPNPYSPKAMKRLSIFFRGVIGSLLKWLGFYSPLLLPLIIFYYRLVWYTLSFPSSSVSFQGSLPIRPLSDLRRTKLLRSCESVARVCSGSYKEDATKLNSFGSYLIQITSLGRGMLADYEGYSHVPYVICYLVVFSLASSIPFIAPPFVMRIYDSQFPLCLGHGFFTKELSNYTALWVSRRVFCVYVTC